MSRQRFAELVGVEDGIVRGWIERGQLPTVKIGRHRLVNLALLQDDCLKAEGLPVMCAHAGITWWNRLTRAERRYWLDVAGSAVPADAFRAYQERADERSGRTPGTQPDLFQEARHGR